MKVVGGNGSWRFLPLLTGACLLAKLVKNLSASKGDTGDMGSILGLGRSPGRGNGNPIQYSCLENSVDRGACGLQPMGLQRSNTTEQLILKLILQLDFKNTLEAQFL